MSCEPQVKHPGRTLVFVNAVSATRRLAALLSHLGLRAIALHASQQQRQRLKVPNYELTRHVVQLGKSSLER